MNPVRFSDLKRFAQSPAHYAYAAEESSRSIAVGNAADTLILGGQVIAYPGAVRRGKEWEAWQAEQDPEALIVTKSELADASGMTAGVSTGLSAIGGVGLYVQVVIAIVMAIAFAFVYTFSKQGGSTRKTGDAWLCRCKQTHNAPNCDGTHKRVPADMVGKEFTL